MAVFKEVTFGKPIDFSIDRSIDFTLGNDVPPRPRKSATQSSVKPEG